MSRLIDADALIAWIKGSQQLTSKIKAVICYIKTMPTSDAVSVVICKDCKHWNKAPNTERGWCDKCDGLLEPNFYCADGEREGE